MQLRLHCHNVDMSVSTESVVALLYGSRIHMTAPDSEVLTAVHIGILHTAQGNSNHLLTLVLRASRQFLYFQAQSRRSWVILRKLLSSTYERTSSVVSVGKPKHVYTDGWTN